MASDADVNVIEYSSSGTEYSPVNDDALLTSFGRDSHPTYDCTRKEEDDIDLLIVDEHLAPRNAEPSPKRQKTLSVKQWTGWSNIQPPSLKPQASGAANKENEPPAADKADDTEEEVDCEPVRDQALVNREEPTARLTFWMPPNAQRERFWTHEQYRSPSGATVEIIYCKTRVECERAAKRFVGEPVIGFDMEWKSSRRRNAIQDNISLIQVACEDKIALFHIAMIKGTTPDELLAPALRNLLVSSTYTKCGVSINSADGNRLRRWMKLEPRGMFELSYFHRVVKFSTARPDQVIKRLISLSSLSAMWLGSPLFKGSVRTSNWTKPLTDEQIKYAASDAYAGFRIYHAIEVERLKMARPPPTPAHTELDLPLLLVDPARVPVDSPRKPSAPPTLPPMDSAAPPPSPISTRAKRQFQVPDLPPEFAMGEKREPTAPVPPAARSPVPRSAQRPAQPPAERPAPQARTTTVLSADDKTTRFLFNALCAKRKRHASVTGCAEASLVADGPLRALAKQRPRTIAGLRSKHPECMAFAAQGEFDLLAFVQKYAPLPPSRTLP